MLDDYFQKPKSDLFQEEFLSGRAIPNFDTALYEIMENDKRNFKTIKFENDETNKSPWITAIYQSVYYAEKASHALPKQGYNVFYPKCRVPEKQIMDIFDSETSIKTRDGKILSSFTPAYGRYIFIQLPEDSETCANIEITERMLSGRLSQNGIVKIMSIDGVVSLTQHSEIITNKTFHEDLIKRTDPKTTLRYSENEVVSVWRGNLAGRTVRIANDIYMHFKLTSKTEVIIENSRARHYVKVGDLEKMLIDTRVAS